MDPGAAFLDKEPCVDSAQLDGVDAAEFLDVPGAVEGMAERSLRSLLRRALMVCAESARVKRQRVGGSQS